MNGRKLALLVLLVLFATSCAPNSMNGAQAESVAEEVEQENDVLQQAQEQAKLDYETAVQNSAIETKQPPANSLPIDGDWSLSYDYGCDGADVMLVMCSFLVDQFDCKNELFTAAELNSFIGTGEWNGSELTLQFAHGSTYVGTQRSDTIWSGVMTNPNNGLGCWIMVKK